MHDEYERALGVRRGTSPLVWFLVAFGLFAAVGVTATFFAVRRGVEAVQERIAALDVGGVAGRVVDRLDDHEALLEAEPEAGLRFLRTLEEGDPSAALLRGLVPTELGSLGAGPEPAGSSATLDQEREREGDRRRSFSFRAGDDELRIDFDRDDDGGSLVIGSGAERVRFDLVRTAEGGFLTIHDGEDEARVDVRKTTDGGRLSIQAPDGRVDFDLVEGEGGGSMIVRTDGDEMLRLGLGSEARAMPRWVPRSRAMPRDPEPVYSLTSDEGLLGAVTWDESSSAVDVVEAFSSRLEGAGFELETEAQDRGGRVERNALWARDADSGRFVFVVAQDDGTRTRVLLGFGEGR